MSSDINELLNNLISMSIDTQPDEKKSRTLTKHYPGTLSPESATNYYTFFKDNIEWEDGIYSKKAKKMSRKAYTVGEGKERTIDDEINKLVESCLKSVIKDEKYLVMGTYINYYRNGLDFCPSHSHKGMVQMVISLGATRKLKVGTKTYEMKNGDVIVFGSSIHEIPIEENIKEGRISIATFMKKL